MGREKNKKTPQIKRLKNNEESKEYKYDKYNDIETARTDI